MTQAFHDSDWTPAAIEAKTFRELKMYNPEVGVTVTLTRGTDSDEYLSVEAESRDTSDSHSTEGCVLNVSGPREQIAEFCSVLGQLLQVAGKTDLRKV